MLWTKKWLILWFPNPNFTLVFYWTALYTFLCLARGKRLMCVLSADWYSRELTFEYYKPCTTIPAWLTSCKVHYLVHLWQGFENVSSTIFTSRQVVQEVNFRMVCNCTRGHDHPFLRHYSFCCGHFKSQAKITSVRNVIIQLLFKCSLLNLLQ